MNKDELIRILSLECKKIFSYEVVHTCNDGYADFYRLFEMDYASNFIEDNTEYFVAFLGENSDLSTLPTPDVILTYLTDDELIYCWKIDQ